MSYVVITDTDDFETYGPFADEKIASIWASSHCGMAGDWIAVEVRTPEMVKPELDKCPLCEMLKEASRVGDGTDEAAG